MKPIKANATLYIKLGVGGEWERECITRNQTLRLGYNDIPHELCLNGDWEKVRHEIKNRYRWNDGVATKTRPVVEKWRNVDINARPLSLNLLSGKLLSMQGFRGTVCSVKESDYLIKKINGIEPADVDEARTAQAAFENQIERIIRRLHWKDFELLVDLIFRQAGWKRDSVLGKSLKTVDMELISPITNERFGVQVKAKADLAIFKSYQEERFANLEGFARFYFAVHSPSSSLEKAARTKVDERIVLLLPRDLAKLSIEYGLASWVIDKAQ